MEDITLLWIVVAALGATCLSLILIASKYATMNSRLRERLRETDNRRRVTEEALSVSQRLTDDLRSRLADVEGRLEVSLGSTRQAICDKYALVMDVQSMKAANAEVVEAIREQLERLSVI